MESPQSQIEKAVAEKDKELRGVKVKRTQRMTILISIPVQTQEKHMANIYSTDLDEEAIVVYVKDHEDLYDKTNRHSIDKPRKKDCL